MMVAGLVGAYRVPEDKGHAGLRVFILIQVRYDINLPDCY